MKKNCKNKQTLLPPTPCEYGGNCPPAPDCEQIFDLDCVNYTGDPIVCNGEVLVESGESLPTVLTTLVDKICNKTNCEIDIEFTFLTGGVYVGSALRFAITGGTPTYTIKPSVVQGPFTGITISDCSSYEEGTISDCFNPVGQGGMGFYVVVYCLPNKFYIGNNNTNKYSGTIRIEVIDAFGCSHDFFYTVVIDEEDCQYEPEHN